jgi:hypothetical protein
MQPSIQIRKEVSLYLIKRVTTNHRRIVVTLVAASLSLHSVIPFELLLITAITTITTTMGSKTWTVSLSSAESPYEERPSVPFLAGMTRRFPLPPIDSLLNITNNVTGKAFRATIIGDVSDLLDSAVIGVAKCGTSTMMEYLN